MLRRSGAGVASINIHIHSHFGSIVAVRTIVGAGQQQSNLDRLCFYWNGRFVLLLSSVNYPEVVLEFNQRTAQSMKVLKHVTYATASSPRQVSLPLQED